MGHCFLCQERRRSIGRDVKSPIAAIGVLSLGLILPIGAGPLTNHATSSLIAGAVEPTKTVTLVADGRSESVQTRATTVSALLSEHHIARTPEDALDTDPEAPLQSGATIHFRSAVPVTLVVDGVTQTVRSAAPTVAAVLADRTVTFDRHDHVVPAPAAALTAGQTIRIDHINSWTEQVRKPVAPSTKHLPTIDLPFGKSQVVTKGVTGIREVSYLVTRRDGHSPAQRRSVFATRLIRAPQPRIIATGIGEYHALAALAERGFKGTIHLASAAIKMVATAYTARCSGCSGTTAMGQPAGQGIVAVDPSVIPLGSHLYIPGYGHALAGDTGGAIRGNRIDLGMNSTSDAFQFGTRNVTVYVLHDNR